MLNFVPKFEKNVVQKWKKVTFYKMIYSKIVNVFLIWFFVSLTVFRKTKACFVDTDEFERGFSVFSSTEYEIEDCTNGF